VLWHIKEVLCYFTEQTTIMFSFSIYCKWLYWRKSESVPNVSPMAVTHAHLISYDPERDVLPLVLANCQYTFEMGKGTKIKYDFLGLERQLMDRFLFSKSRIDVGNVLQVCVIYYTWCSKSFFWSRRKGLMFIKADTACKCACKIVCIYN